MDDGFKVPPAHDGMAAFAGPDGRVILVCNHEMPPAFPEYSAFGTGFQALPERVEGARLRSRRRHVAGRGRYDDHRLRPADGPH